MILGAVALTLCCAAPAAAGSHSPKSSAPGWSAAVLPALTGPLGGISCQPSGKHERCLAVGQSAAGGAALILLSTDGGKTWAPQPAPTGIPALFRVACTSVARCWAAGVAASGAGAVVATTDGGLSWQAQPIPAVNEVGRISCKLSHCVAGGGKLGDRLLVTRDGGTKWSRKTLPQACHTGCPAYIADDVTMASASVAYAVGGSQCGGSGVTQCPAAIWKSSDGGASWHLVYKRSPFVDAISCRDASHCWAAAATFKTGVVLATADGGRHWRAQTLPQFSGYFNAISCLRSGSHDRCYAVGQNESGTAPVIAVTANGGTSWKLVAAPHGTGSLFGVDAFGTAARAAGQSLDGARGTLLLS